MHTNKKTTPARSLLALLSALAILSSHILAPIPFLPQVHAANDDYLVAGGDPGSLPAVGAVAPLGIITLTDVDGDDFFSNAVENFRVTLNTAAYPGIHFDTSAGVGAITVGGSCGFNSAGAVSYGSATQVDVFVSGAAPVYCGAGTDVTIDGLRITSIHASTAPAAAPLISVDNRNASPGSPVPSSTIVSYATPAADPNATMTFSSPAVGNVGNATLNVSLPSGLDQNDSIVITFPGNFNLSAMDVATTGTLGGASTFNCIGFGATATCTADGNTNAMGTLVMTGIIAATPSNDDIISVQVADEGILANLIAEDTTVATTDILGSNNVITNIDAQDTNADGTIDSFLLSVDNENARTAASHDTSGWAVTDDGLPVAIDQVSIVGAANANPLMIRVDLVTTDPNLDKHDTTTNTLELSYTPQGVDAGFEFDDGANTQLVAIATGDTGAGDTENDVAGPVLLSWTYNAVTFRMQLDWSEPVIATAPTYTALTLQDAALATVSQGLTGGSVQGNIGNSLQIELSNPDQTTITGTAGLLKNMGNSYLRMASGFVTDAAHNDSTAIIDGQAIQASTYTAPTPPTPVVVVSGGGGGGGGGFAPSGTSLTPKDGGNGNTNSNANTKMMICAPGYFGSDCSQTYTFPINSLVQSPAIRVFDAGQFTLSSDLITFDSNDEGKEFPEPLNTSSGAIILPLTGSSGSIMLEGTGGTLTVGADTKVMAEPSWDGIIQAPKTVPIQDVMTGSGVITVEDNQGEMKKKEIPAADVLAVVKVGSDTSPLAVSSPVRLSLQFTVPLSTVTDLGKFTSNIQNDLSQATGVSPQRFSIVQLTTEEASPEVTVNNDCDKNPTLEQNSGNSFMMTVSICHLSYYAVILTDSETGFWDLPANYPFTQAVGYLKNLGIMTGYADGSFQSEKAVNRAEFTKMIVQAKFGLNPRDFAQDCFMDVAKDAWYASYICFAKKNGLVSGYDDGSFRPGKSINLAEASKILAQAFDLPQIKPKGTAWFSAYLEAMEAGNYIPKTFISTGQTVKRGDASEMLWRLLEGVHNLPSTVLVQ